MAENEKQDDNKAGKKKHLTAAEKEELALKMKEETEHWMKTNERVKAFLDRHDPSGVDSFIESYKNAKCLFMTFGDLYATITENRDEETFLLAQERLMDIQRKKLFDLMCLWNADQFRHPDLLCSWDFLMHEMDIMNSTIVERITPEDFEFYMLYAHTENFRCNEYFDIHQLEPYITKEMGENDIDLPEWFQFDNLHRGNSKYLVLPNLHMPREEFYANLDRAERNRGIEKKYETGELTRYVPSDKPKLKAYDYAFLKSFVSVFERREVMEKFLKYYDNNSSSLIREDEEEERNAELDEQVERILHEWTGLKEKVPIKAHADWREALIDAYEERKRSMVREALPIVYEDYCMRVEQGLGIDWGKDESDHWVDMINSFRDSILRGRELNGEPRDFNF
jgi:hypothetical protein